MVKGGHVDVAPASRAVDTAVSQSAAQECNQQDQNDERSHRDADDSPDR